MERVVGGDVCVGGGEGSANDAASLISNLEVSHKYFGAFSCSKWCNATSTISK